VAPGRCGHINHLVVSESVSQLVVTFPLWSVTRVREFCQSSEVWRFSGNFCATTRFLQRCPTRRKECKKWNRSQSEDLVSQAFAAAADSSSCSSTTGGGVCSRSEAQIVPVARPLRAASPLEVGLMAHHHARPEPRFSVRAKGQLADIMAPTPCWARFSAQTKG